MKNKDGDFRDLSDRGDLFEDVDMQAVVGAVLSSVVGGLSASGFQTEHIRDNLRIIVDREEFWAHVEASKEALGVLAEKLWKDRKTELQ